MSMTETVARETVRPAQYIDGEWTIGQPARTFEVHSPIDGCLLATLPEASAEDVDRAISTAVHTYKTVHLTPSERYEVLTRGATLIRQRADDLASIIVEEAGKPIRDARAEVARAVQTFTLCAEEAKRLHGETIPFAGTSGSENRFGFTMRAPVGVVCAITPFNAPLNQLNHKVPPAIAAGDTIVLKPAEVTPLSAIAAVEILEEAGLPKGIVNMVQGPGETVGEMLLHDPRFAVYTFTGSMAIGKHIREQVGLRRTLLELGSNSGVIIHRDADLERAAAQCAKGAFVYSGQICISVQRILVHEHVRDAFLQRFVPKVEALVVGDPRQESTDVGPMISVQAAEKAEQAIRHAAITGATILTGGTRNGNYLSPTIMAGVQPEHALWCEEAFAPVVTVASYTDVDDAIERVNDSPYGLQAGVFTESMDLAMKAARLLEVGGVMINDVPTYRIDAMPYGGVKGSGIGREGVKYAIDELTDMRLVAFNLRERFS